MKVKLIKEWDDNEVGTVLEVDEETFKGLTNDIAGIAKEWSADDEAAEKAAAAKSDQDTEKLTKMVGEVVKNALKEQPKSNDTLGVRVIVDPDKKDKPFKSFGEQLVAIRKHQMGRANEEIHNRLKAATGHNELVDADGGYLVGEDMQSMLEQRAMETGILAARANTVEISSNSNTLAWNELDDYDRTAANRPVTSYWTEEAGTKVASKADFIRQQMQLEKLIGLTYVTDELLQDTSALTAEVSRWFGMDFGYRLDSAIYAGDGAGKPLGILNSNALVSQAKESGQTAATINATNVAKMFARMPGQYIPGAVWLINQDAYHQLPLMTIGDQPIWLPPTGFVDAPAGLLLGRPVVMFEHCKTLGTVGDIMFVNLAEYKMIRKGGIQSASSIHVRFVNDETAIRFVMRVNGQPAWSKSITPAQGSNTLSPYVVLATRA